MLHNLLGSIPSFERYGAEVLRQLCVRKRYFDANMLAAKIGEGHQALKYGFSWSTRFIYPVFYLHFTMLVPKIARIVLVLIWLICDSLPFYAHVHTCSPSYTDEE